MKTNDSAGLSSQELKKLRAALLAARSEILGHAKPEAAHAPDVGDAMDMADQVAHVEESGARTERDRSRLADIDHALGKMERGDYGVSEGSGEPIGFGRFNVLPWARLTVAEEEALERRK